MFITLISQPAGKSSRSSRLPQNSCVGMMTDFAEPLFAATLVAWYGPAAMAVPMRGAEPTPVRKSLRFTLSLDINASLSISD